LLPPSPLFPYPTLFRSAEPAHPHPGTDRPADNALFRDDSGAQNRRGPAVSGKPALILLGIHARPAAQVLMAAFPNWDVYAPDEAALPHSLPLGSATETIAALFRDGRPVSGLCAAGILIRAVARHLGDKHNE